MGNFGGQRGRAFYARSANADETATSDAATTPIAGAADHLGAAPPEPAAEEVEASSVTDEGIEPSVNFLRGRTDGFRHR